MVNTVDGNRLCKEGTGVLRGRSTFPDSSAGGKLMSHCLEKPRASPSSWVPGHTVSHPRHDAGPALSPEALPRSQPWGRGASPACASGRPLPASVLFVERPQEPSPRPHPSRAAGPGLCSGSSCGPAGSARLCPQAVGTTSVPRQCPPCLGPPARPQSQILPQPVPERLRGRGKGSRPSWGVGCSFVPPAALPATT